MSWLYSRALVEGYSEERFSDGGQSARLRETSTPQAYWFSDKTTDTWSPSRFGVTSAPLTESRGGAVLTSFLEAFPVKTSARQEREQGLEESDQGCGWKWRESLMKYDRDSCLWKTRQSLLLGGLEEFSETWPRWGTMRTGESWGRTMPEHLTSEIGSGSLLATPTATANQLSPSMMKHRGCRNWLPTPQSNDWKGPNLKQGSKSQSARSLSTWAERFPTPVADDTGHRQKKYSQGGTALSCAIGGKLNPNWVEWLMGWPIGWTDLKPLETDKCQQWQRLHGRF